MRSGFTLLEIVIVFAITAVVSLFTLPLGIQSYRNYILSSDTRNLLSVLRRAESLATSNAYKSSFGIYLESDKVTLFRGSSYASRNSSFDETYLFSKGITVSASTTEIVFAERSSRPSATTTINLDNGIKPKAVSVNSEGTVFW